MIEWRERGRKGERDGGRVREVERSRGIEGKKVGGREGGRDP